MAAQTAPHEYRSLIIASAPAVDRIAAYLVLEDHFAMHTWRPTERQRGVGIGYVVGRHLNAQFDFRYITSGDEIVDRWTPALTTHWTAAAFRISARTRAKILDLRRPSTGHAWSTRWLEKLMVVRPQQLGPAIVAPFAAVEPAYDPRYATINRWEERVGVRLPVRDVTTDLYGVWWQDSRSAPRRYAGAGIELHVAP